MSQDDPTRRAEPDQVDTGFEEGAEHKPDSPEENLEPNYARGLSEEAEGKGPGRYSKGEDAGTPEDEAEGDFGEGSRTL